MSVNVSETYFKNNKNNLNTYLDLIFKEKKNRSIQNKLLNDYLEVRYYNYSDEVGNLKSIINKYLKESSIKLNDYNENINLINNYLYVFNELYLIDSSLDENIIKTRINELDNYRKKKMNISDTGFKNELFKIMKADLNKNLKFVNAFETPDFEISFDKQKNINVYNVNLNYNIIFNNLYSNYAITNAFNTGLVNEKKEEVLYYLYSATALRNIIKGEFNKNYLLEFDASLFNKRKKLNMILNIINSDPVKEFTILKISFSDYNNFKDDIYELKRNGFNFAVIIDNSYEENEVNYTKLRLFKYVIIDNEEYKYDSLLNLDNLILM